jgi:RNA polymerase sigma-70 factor (ECF subfamily)
MQYRKKKHEYVSLEDEDDLISESSVADWNSVPSFTMENKELRTVLDHAIQNLAPEYRIVFLLRDVEGLSTEETGKITELSVPAVKSRLHRARAFLRKEISKTFKR